MTQINYGVMKRDAQRGRGRGRERGRKKRHASVCNQEEADSEDGA